MGTLMARRRRKVVASIPYGATRWRGKPVDTKRRSQGRTRREGSVQQVSDVRVIKPDGTETTQAALRTRQLAKVVKERDQIPPVLRNKVIRRDRGRCRYCRNEPAVIHIDHVLPVVRGGLTT